MADMIGQRQVKVGERCDGPPAPGLKQLQPLSLGGVRFQNETGAGRQLMFNQVESLQVLQDSRVIDGGGLRGGQGDFPGQALCAVRAQELLGRSKSVSTLDALVAEQRESREVAKYVNAIWTDSKSPKYIESRFSDILCSAIFGVASATVLFTEAGSTSFHLVRGILVVCRLDPYLLLSYDELAGRL